MYIDISEISWFLALAHVINIFHNDQYALEFRNLWGGDLEFFKYICNTGHIYIRNIKSVNLYIFRLKVQTEKKLSLLFLIY